MDIFLVRHGQPDWTPDRIARNDPDLTSLGHEQAKRVAHRLAQVQAVDELWVSSMNRALQTSVPVSAEIEKVPEVYDWLEEIRNPPEWDGSPAEEIDKAFQVSNLRNMEEMWDGLPGGETFRAFHRRVVTGLQGTLWHLEDPSQRVIIVAHAGTNAVILGHLLGLEPVPWEWERFSQPHTGVSRLTMSRISTGWAFSLRQLGDVGHLPEEMITA